MHKDYLQQQITTYSLANTKIKGTGRLILNRIMDLSL